MSSASLVPQDITLTARDPVRFVTSSHRLVGDEIQGMIKGKCTPCCCTPPSADVLLLQCESTRRCSSKPAVLIDSAESKRQHQLICAWLFRRARLCNNKLCTTTNIQAMEKKLVRLAFFVTEYFKLSEFLRNHKVTDSVLIEHVYSFCLFAVWGFGNPNPWCKINVLFWNRISQCLKILSISVSRYCRSSEIDAILRQDLSWTKLVPYQQPSILRTLFQKS